MADEDALFAEFMGEIKSAQADIAPPADDDTASETASVGEVEGEGGSKEMDTGKRKGDAEVTTVQRVQLL